MDVDAQHRQLVDGAAPLRLMADPSGHGFCLIQFNQGGYDAVA
jgi:hypothetical protein